MLFITAQIKLNADEVDYRGVLRYAPGSAAIQYRTMESSRTDVKSIYVFVANLEIWAHHAVSETAPYHLTRTYLQGENLYQQIYAIDNDEKNPWLKPTLITNTSLKNELLKLKARPAEMQDAPVRQQRHAESIDWKDNCNIEDLQHRSPLRAYGLAHFLKTMLFDHVIVILKVLKAESRSEDEYLKAIAAVISDTKFDAASTQTQNNIGDLKAVLSVKSIYTLVRAFLIRVDLDESISYRSVYDFCILILNEELLSHGRTAVAAHSLDQDLQEIMISNTPEINNDLITLLCDIYDEAVDLESLDIIELDSVISALTHPADFAQEMATFYAIIQSEFESDQHGADLSSQEIEQNCAALLEDLSILYNKKMFAVGFSPTLYSLPELRLFIAKIEDHKNFEYYLPQVKTVYEFKLAAELIERTLNSIEALQQTPVRPLPESYLRHLNDAAKFNANVGSLTFFLKNLNQADRRILTSSIPIRNLLGICFAKQKIQANHGFSSIFHIVLEMVDKEDGALVNREVVEALMQLDTALLKGIFMGADINHFSAVVLLNDQIRYALTKMYDVNEKQALEKMAVFEQIVNGALIYRVCSNFENEVPNLNLIQINILLGAFKNPDASLAMTFFFSMLEEDRCDEVGTKLKQYTEQLEARGVFLVKQMLEANNPRVNHKEQAALLVSLKKPSVSTVKMISHISEHIARLEKIYLMTMATLWVQSMAKHVREDQDDEVIIARALLIIKVNPMDDNTSLSIFSENSAKRLMIFLKNLPNNLQVILTHKRSSVLREAVAQCFTDNRANQLTANQLGEVIYDKIKTDATQSIFHPVDIIQTVGSVDKQSELIDIYFKACYENKPKDEETLANMVYNLSVQQWVQYFQHHPEQMHKVKDNHAEDFESTLNLIQNTSIFIERDGARKLQLFECISKKDLSAASSATSLSAFLATNAGGGSVSSTNASSNSTYSLNIN